MPAEVGAILEGTVIRLAPYAHDFGHAHVITVRGDHLAGASEPRALDGAAAGY